MIKEFKPETLPQEDIIITKVPGMSDDKLDANYQVRNVSGQTYNYVETQKFDRLSTVGTGNQTFSGFGFTPTHYEIFAYRYANTTNPVWSQAGRDINGTEGGFAFYSNTGYHSTYSLRVDNTGNGGLKTFATFVAFTSDGVTLNFGNSDEDIRFTLTCYG